MSEGSGEQGGRVVNLPAAPAMGFLATLALLSAAVAFMGAIVLALVGVILVGYYKHGWLGATLGATILGAAYIIGETPQAFFNFGACILILFVLYLPTLLIGGNKK